MYNLLILTTMDRIHVRSTVSNHLTYEAAETAVKALESEKVWPEIMVIRLYRKA
jgi:hypothetical protein